MRGTAHVALAPERAHHAAGRALVQAQLGGQRVEGGRPAAQKRLEGVALGKRDVVAAEPAPLADQVGADEVRAGLVEGLARAVEVGVEPCRGIHRWHRQLYSLPTMPVKQGESGDAW